MTILCYHEVDPRWASEVAVTPTAFDEQMRWLSANRRVVALEDAVQALDSHWRLPRRMAAVTFDDGFAGVFDHAFPALRRLDIPATVFVVAATLTKDRHEVDRAWYGGDDSVRTLVGDQILEMSEMGVGFGSHGLTHRLLTELTDVECEREMRESREVLEELLRTPVTMLAYPAGRHDRRVRGIAERAGYRWGFGLPDRREEWGRYSVPRVGIYRGNRLRTVRIKAARPYLLFRTRVMRRRPADGRATPARA